MSAVPAEFYYKVVEKTITDESGATKTVYVDEPRIKFRVDNHSSYERRVREEDKKLRPKQWEAFAKDGTLEYDGTPLSEAPFITPATLKNLNFLGFYTIEHLADAPSNQIDGLMGGIDFQNRAKAWLKAKSGAVDVDKMAKEQTQLSETVTVQSEQIKELQEQLKKSEADRAAALAIAKEKEVLGDSEEKEASSKKAKK